MFGKYKKCILTAGLCLCIVLVTITAYANSKILRYAIHITPDPTALPPSELALVFGGGMRGPGEQSYMQIDRVKKGVELYKMGKVRTLMMTGDDGGLRGDEVHAMRDLAISLGVPSSSISIDPHGYRTYESCYREKHVYGITSALAISQSFHLPRIIYLCNSLGVNVLGVSADMSNYGIDLPKMQLRDVLAKVLAWWQVEYAHPLPRSLEK